MNESKFLSMLGLCRRAGAVIIGTDLVTRALPSKKVKIVFCSAGASQNTKKRITDKCSFYNVRLLMIDTPEDVLGGALGKSAGVCVVGITDDNFSRQLLTLSGADE